MIAIAILVGAVVGFGVAWVLYPPLHRASALPPPLPPADHTPLLVEAIAAGMASAAEAVGKAVQTAQYAPAEPERQTRRVLAFDPDVANGEVDTSDPTDIGWLHPDRPDVTFEAPPGGWPSG